MRQAIVAFLSLLAIVLGGLRGEPASADPSFSNVTDILGGSRHLLRADDLVFAVQSKEPYRTAVLPTKALSVDLSRTSIEGRCGVYPDPFLVRIGRVFALKNDVVVRIAPLTTGSGCPGNDLGLYVEDPQNGANNTVTPLTGLRGARVQIALGDFNHDGFADIVVFDNVGGLRIYTAVKAENPAGGVHLVEPASLLGLTAADLDLWSDPVVGDFNGDGVLEVAWVSTGSPTTNGTVFLASVCPAAGAKVLGQTCSRAFQAMVSPHTILTGGVTRAFLTSGDYDGVPSFTGMPAQELLMVREFFGQSENARFLTHDMSVSSFDKDLVPTHKGGLVFGTSQAYPPAVDPPPSAVVTSGRLRWNGKTDQVVFAHGWPTDALYVITFDHALTMTAHQTKFDQFSVPLFRGNDDPFICFDHLGLAAGRYDPPKDGDNSNVNLQVALFVRSSAKTGGRDGTCDHPRDTVVAGGHVAIFTIDFTGDLALSLASFSAFLVPGASVTGNLLLAAPASNVLWAGDAQGRSLFLGAPRRVTVENLQQPHAIITAPPMHVDFVTPQDSTDPVVLNLSAVPDSFTTQYSSEQSKSVRSSDQHSTSWSKGVEEKVSAYVTLGSVELQNFIEQDFNFAAEQTWKGSTEIHNEQYSSQSFDLSVATGFDDQVLYTDSRFNLYIYPVIGQQACPDTPPCPDDQKRPLFIQVSGADQIQYSSIGGADLEFYQPPWEPGNVFSYPASEAQLRKIYPDIQILTEVVTWATDDSKGEETVSWKSSSGKSQSASSKQTFSEDVSTTTAGAISEPGLIAAGGSFTVGGAFKNSTAALNTQETSVENSTGIRIEKPRTFRDPTTYQYLVTPYVFGALRPQGYVNDQGDPPTDIKTFGPLRTAFLADPTDPRAGTWWSTAVYRDKPDVALNHPKRWDIGPQTSQTKPESCLRIAAESAGMQCATPHEPNPDDLWHSSFYFLRGFFIANEGAKGPAPQLQVATAGDKLVLQTRVYNYSFKEMPAGTTVHVRFYGQPWNHIQLKPKDVDSFLIGEDKIGLIPPFRNDNGDAPLNWVLAETTFDTSSHADQYLIFWVIVWMQDPQGGLVAELAHHGLSSGKVPGALNSLKDAHEIACGKESPCFSNNVGFYKFPFYVKGKNLTTPPPLPSEPARLGPVQLSSDRVVRGERVKVSTSVLAAGSAVPGATVRFYDGDPGAGGKLFDVERVAHIRENDTHLVSALFKPGTCGFHSIFAVVGTGSSPDQVSQSLPLFLNCRRR